MSVVLEAGKRIAELRRRKGMTQEQLGQQLSITGQAVSKWENGDSLPDTLLLVSLARTLDCTTDYLLGADHSGGVSRLIPTIEAELRDMVPGEKIDLAFSLFHLIDKASRARSAQVAERNMPGAGLPFIHAGPDGVTLWWKGKFMCNISLDALQETEAVWNDRQAPFELFTESESALIAAVVTHKHYFNSDTPIAEASLKEESALDDDGFAAAADKLMGSGLLEKGKGGYRVGIRAEVLLRVLGVLLHSVSKPGGTSQSSFLKS